MANTDLPVLLTPLGEFEVFNAFRLRQFRREASASNVKAAAALFAKDVEAGVLRVGPLAVAMFGQAKRLTRNYTSRLGTRTLDVFHVASALILRADTFLTFDRNQARLAKAEHLSVP